MLYQNLYIENAEHTSDIRVTDGRFEEISGHIEPRPGEECVDFGGKLALPPFIESHVHLDTSLTAGNPDWNLSGSLFEGIECWTKRKQTLTREDIRQRATRLIRMYAANGIQHIRTHIDVTDPKLLAMETVLKLREELRDVMDIQVVAFPQEGIESFPNSKQLLEDSIRMGADCVGAIPHFEFTREYSVSSLNFAMKLAEKYDKLVDVHCDEIDDEASRGLETLAARAYESGMRDRVTASHTTAMHSYNNAYVQRLMRLLCMSGINFVSNPLVNINLQGRIDTYPKRRGLTRVKELTEAGINVSFGHDDISDYFYPMGTGSLREVVFMGLHACQMLGYEEIRSSYKFVANNAARTLHLGDRYGIAPGRPADFIIMDAKDYYEALNTNAVVLASIKGGRTISQSTPASSKVLF